MGEEAGATSESLVLRVTALLAKHDPAFILGENQDAPPDEYLYEAEEILQRVRSGAPSQLTTLEIVEQVFIEELGREEVSSNRLRRASWDIDALLYRRGSGG